MPMPDILQLDTTARLAVVEGIAQPQVLDGRTWRRAAPGDGVGEALLALLAGTMEPRAPFSAERFASSAGSGERAIAVDQTNESWVVGDSVVKWATQRLEAPHPAPERLHRLVAAGFPGMPRPRGLVTWNGIPAVQVVAYVPGAADGWEWCVREARIALGAETGETTPFAAELGRLTRAMHEALAVSTHADVEVAAREWVGATSALARAARLSGDELLGRSRGRIEAAFEPLRRLAGTPLIAVHGDFHVGNVLRADGALLVTDFDGNPTQSPLDRVAHRPAAVDVAGMLTSVENVGLVVRRYASELEEAAVAEWIAQAQGEFLDGYGPVPDVAVLEAYRWQQLCREYVYAAEHLPRWMYVPRAALRRRLEERQQNPE